jgi:hypothetical protein
MRFEDFAPRLAEDRGLHARFANTLSMLEYIGARKILKSQRAGDMTLDTLSHAAEEIRHAQLLKRLALTLSDGALTTWEDGQVLQGPLARAYFQGIDASCAAVLGAPDPVSNYALTTLLIEERATALYPAWADLLDGLGVPHRLRALIREEEGHLADIRGWLAASGRIGESALATLRAGEEAAFGALVAAMAA